MYITGELPGTGEYHCILCGQSVQINDPAAPLPLCPKCENYEFVRVRY